MASILYVYVLCHCCWCAMVLLWTFWKIEHSSWKMHILCGLNFIIWYLRSDRPISFQSPDKNTTKLWLLKTDMHRLYFGNYEKNSHFWKKKNTWNVYKVWYKYKFYSCSRAKNFVKTYAIKLIEWSIWRYNYHLLVYFWNAISDIRNIIIL